MTRMKGFWGKLSGRPIWATALALLLLIGAAVAAVAQVGDPDKISFTLEGCNLDHGGTFDITTLTCSDDAYTTGNLGKSWAELDLVPHRVTLDNGNGDQTYAFIVAGDYKHVLDGPLGWDAISELSLNMHLSDDSCTEAETGPLRYTPSGSGVGGADQTIYRTVTVTQTAGSICVYDYAQRLAIGASGYSGSSLQSNLWNQNLGSSGIGQKRIQLPVAEIAPQELSKDMSATQGADHIWNLTKAPTPATLTFNNTCADPEANQQDVAIAIEWEKLPAAPEGQITVVTNIYATNPSHRPITVTVTDTIRSGVDVLDIAVFTPVLVQANNTRLVGTHAVDVPDGTTDLNDVATATYEDAALAVPVPGQTTAVASADVQPLDPVQNQTAVVTDTESITGDFFIYSTDSFEPADIGFFQGYVPGTPTDGEVVWVSNEQSDSGVVTFTKTVSVTQAAITSGTLTDTAVLVGADGFFASAEADVDLQAFAQVQLTINKTIPDVLTGDETATFTFDITGPAGYTDTVSIDFTAGETSQSVTLTGLQPGSYTVSEDDPGGGWDEQTASRSVDITLPTCSGQVMFNNTYTPARARVKKVTDPVGEEAGWEFTLNGPGGPVTATTTGAGSVEFDLDLQEGSYTVTETDQAGWDETGSTGCEFTVNYPADAGRTFECEKENTQRGKIIVEKQTEPDGSSQSFDFDADYESGFSLADGETDESDWLVPDTYAVTETVPAGWELVSAVCDDGSDPGSIGLDPGETVVCTFTNAQRGKIIVEKQTEPDGSTVEFEFDASYYETVFFLRDGEQNHSGDLVPGIYTITETVPAGWDLDGVRCTSSKGDTETSDSIDLQAGETVTCTFTNLEQQPAPPFVDIEVIKDVEPSQVEPLDPFTYTVEVRNTSWEIPFDSLPLTDTLPTADFHYVAGSARVGGAAQEPDVVAEPLLGWNSLGSLPAQESITVTYAVTVPEGTVGTYTNTAVAAGHYMIEDEPGVVTDDDDAEVYIETTAVTLLYFRAQPLDEAVRLDWSSAAEWDHVGYYIYRAETRDFEDAVRVTYVDGQGSGSTYEYTDEDVEVGVTYWYWLVDLDVNGVQSPSHPVWARVGGGFRIFLPLVCREP